MPNDDFAEMVAVFHVDERSVRLRKVECSINDWLDPMLADESVHGFEVRARTNENAGDARAATDHCGSRNFAAESGESADDGDMTAMRERRE